MKTKKYLSRPDFQYAEFSGDVSCPFCNVLLKTKPLDRLPGEDANDERDNEVDYYPDGGGLCKHIGFWCDSEFPSVNENWRKEMFKLTSTLKSHQYDGEAGYHWQEALLWAVEADGKGCIGWSAANAIPHCQVAVYKQFSNLLDTPGWRHMHYMAIIVRKKRLNKSVKRAAAQGEDS